MRTPLLPLSLSLALPACAKPGPQPAGPVAVAEVPAVTAARQQTAWATASVELLDNFKRVHFDTDSAALDRRAQLRLDRAAAILQEHPEVEVVAMGHADARGPATDNRRLARERAEAVTAYLEAKGVADRQVTARSAGESHPRIDRSTHRAWSKNRRVELIVVQDPYNEVDGSEDNADREASWIPDTHF